MWPEPGALAIVGLLGAWAAADGTSVGQILVSRPIFAATLAGAVAGNAAAGAAVGAVLEVFHLGVLPAGAARYPESGPAAVAGGAVYAANPLGWFGLLIVVAVCLVCEWIAGASVHRMRQANIRIATLDGRRTLSPAELQRRHWSAILLDALRGFAVTAVSLVLLALLLASLPAPPEPVEYGARLVVAGAVVALLAAAGRMFSGRVALLAVGMAIGAAVLMLR